MRFRAGAIAVALTLALPHAALGANDPLRSQQWGLDMIEADAAHSVATGAGAVVAVVDSGVLDTHPDLGGRLLAGHDFVDDDGNPQDGNGHGTHVTGIIAANAGNGVGVSSVAPGANVLPVRVLGDDGSGSSGDVVAGIDWAAANGADVINLSLGEDVPLLGSSEEFAAAVDRALDKGLIVVAASGNDALPACEQPSAEGRLLCVGAVDKRGMRSFFSSFGRGLGVVAPGGSGVPVDGENILSSWNDGGGLRHLAGGSTRRRRGGAARLAGPARPGGGQPDPYHREGRGPARPRPAVRGRDRERAGGGVRSRRRLRRR